MSKTDLIILAAAALAAWLLLRPKRAGSVNVGQLEPLSLAEQWDAARNGPAPVWGLA